MWGGWMWGGWSSPRSAYSSPLLPLPLSVFCVCVCVCVPLCLCLSLCGCPFRPVSSGWLSGRMASPHSAYSSPGAHVCLFLCVPSGLCVHAPHSACAGPFPRLSGWLCLPVWLAGCVYLFVCLPGRMVGLLQQPGRTSMDRLGGLVFATQPLPCRDQRRFAPLSLCLPARLPACLPACLSFRVLRRRGSHAR